LAGSLGEWPAEELPPQPRRGPAEQGRADSHALGASPK
jgi:hypothetical protein